MTFPRLGALLAVLTIAGLPIAAQSADSPAPTPGMTGQMIDAQAQIDALKDIPSNSWAYQSIIDLVNDGIIVGYPDGTFKGARPLTRYEAAVMVERAVQYLTKKLGNPQTASEVTQKDIDALRALLDEFRGDIDALKLRVSDIDSRLKTVEANQKTDEATANRARIGATYFVRAGSLNESTAAYTNAFPAGGAPGCVAAGLPICGGSALALPAGTALTGGNPGANAGNQGSSNKYLAGANTQGYGYQLLRLTLDGTLDPSLSYHIRLENRLFWDSPSAQDGSLATFPGGTVAATPSLTGIATVNGYPANTVVRFNYGYAQYQDAGTGLGASVGRVNETDGTLGLLWADQWNGASIGYNKYGLNIRGSYGFTWPQYDSVANNNPLTQPTPGSACTPAISGAGTAYVNKCSGLATQILSAQLSYTVNKQLMVGGAYINDINDQILDWNDNVCSLTGLAPTAGGAHPGACQQYAGGGFIVPTAANGYAATGAFTAPYVDLAEGSLFMRYQDTIAKLPVSLEAEGSYRFGNDPNTGTTWKQPMAVWVQGKIGAFNPPRSARISKPAISARASTRSHRTAQSPTARATTSSIKPTLRATSSDTSASTTGSAATAASAWSIRHPTSSTARRSRSQVPRMPAPYLTHDISNGVFVQTWLQF